MPHNYVQPAARATSPGSAWPKPVFSFPLSTMPPYRPHFATSQSGLAWLTTDDGSRTLWSEQAGETYHSGCGAVAESLVVYLLHSGVAERLQQKQATKVLEVGFGTGTDFLLTAAVAEHFQVPLEFTALDCSLLPLEIVQSLHQGNLRDRAEDYCQANGIHWLHGAFAAAEELLASLLDAIAIRAVDSAKGHGYLQLRISELVTLNLILGDAREFDGHADQNAGNFDAVYFDPFSPESSPELWTAAVFSEVFACVTNGGTLTTYCVKGHVRRGLEACGFAVKKLPGPVGGKREVLIARK